MKTYQYTDPFTSKKSAVLDESQKASREMLLRYGWVEQIISDDEPVIQPEPVSPVVPEVTPEAAKEAFDEHWDAVMPENKRKPRRSKKDKA